ncbi:MAG: GH3 auxin-responsive promoter family protein [Candidatus Eremiobacteraeota bacterium]|nr:GH3 auxin-responsive promoter family protein [Candidatus Eremiobacteraeota bacterium]
MRPWLGNALWWLGCWPERLAFERAARRPEAAQRRRLFELVGTSYERFRESYPVVEFDDLERAGWPGLGRVLHWQPTGGSCGATRKIPYTRALRAEFQRAVAAWVADMFWRQRSLLDGRAYWVITPPVTRPESGSFGDDAGYLGPLARRILDSVLVRPDYRPESYWMDTARALLAARDLRLVSLWSPTYWLLLVECIQANGLRPPNSRPRDWWPHLQAISCWADGPSRAYAHKLQGLFPQVEIAAKGLLATEGVVTIPIAGRRPLALRSHFFEFESEGRVYPAWQLEQGREYAVLLTTGGGLRRYRLGDRVRVEGCYRATPSLVFVGREQVADRFGEKLHFAHVGRALEPFEFAMLAFEEGGYVLFFEGEVPDAPARVEQELLANFHYRHCLDLGQLRPLRGFRLVGGTAQYTRVCQLLGQRLGEIKPMPVHPYEGWSQALEGRWV